MESTGILNIVLTDRDHCGMVLMWAGLIDDLP